jgi:nitrogen fixation-related uncharacterized protein
MITFLQQVDSWFLVFLVIVFGGYFLWSIKGLFDDLKSSIKDLEETIKELFEHRNDHEVRLTALETRCDMIHKESVFK